MIWLREGHRLKLSLAVVSGLVAAYAHSVTLIAALLGLVGGGLLTCLGLFLVGYGGDTGGDDDVYVNLGGTRVIVGFGAVWISAHDVGTVWWLPLDTA